MNLVDIDSKTKPREIVKRVVSGDSAAEQELVRRYSRGIDIIIRKIVRSEAAAEEAYQETFKLVLDKIRRGELRNPERLSGFVHTVARNVVIDLIRGRVRDRTNVLDVLGAALDSRLARMQTPDSRRALNKAFHASSEQLGHAAFKAARLGELRALNKVQVCKLTNVQPHVLRYWETEFPMLAPQKNRAGRRVYRGKDIELVLRIRDLLYEKRFTIAAAKRKLLDEWRPSSARTRSQR